jgi:hypothetical protein
MVRKLPALFTGLFTASLILAGLGSPSRAEAKSEKWWNPDRGDGVHSQRSYKRSDRQWRSWRGQRIYRDVIVVRSGNRGPRYRAWRAYSRPEYIYSRRIIRVRPVRLYVGASIVIGGVHIRGAYRDHGDYAYGCNFCDARFSDYSDYHAHVTGCSHRPAGYRVDCSDWGSGAGSWDDEGWRDDDGDGDYRPDYRRHDDQGDQDDEERYDDYDYDR